MTLSRVESALPPELELLAEQTIGCCLTVHRAIGSGMNESVYSRACCLEFETVGIPYQCERSVSLYYRGTLIGTQRIDLFVAERLVLEVKSVDRIHPVHIAQTVSYLRATGTRIGLVVNFNVPMLKNGIRRVVL
jgi:GxxExxY protein